MYDYYFPQSKSVCIPYAVVLLYDEAFVKTWCSCESGERETFATTEAAS